MAEAPEERGICNLCAAPVTAQDSGWRWAGTQWQHHCEGIHCQAGHPGRVAVDSEGEIILPTTGPKSGDWSTHAFSGVDGEGYGAVLSGGAEVAYWNNGESFDLEAAERLVAAYNGRLKREVIGLSDQEKNLIIHALAGLGALASPAGAAAVGLDGSAAGLRIAIIRKLCRE